MELQNGATSIEINIKLQQKLKIEWLYDLAIIFLDVYLRELKAGSPIDISTHIHSNAILEDRKRPNVHWRMKIETKCDTHKWNIMQPYERKKACHILQHVWNMKTLC